MLKLHLIYICFLIISRPEV